MYGLARSSTRWEKTLPRSLRSTNAPDSCCTPRDSRPLRPSPFLPTAGTIGCTAIVRSACARCVLHRRSATAAISTAAPGQSIGAPRRSKASQTAETFPSESRPRSCASLGLPSLETSLFKLKLQSIGVFQQAANGHRRLERRRRSGASQSLLLRSIHRCEKWRG